MCLKSFARLLSSSIVDEGLALLPKLARLLEASFSKYGDGRGPFLIDDTGSGIDDGGSIDGSGMLGEGGGGAWVVTC